MSELLIITPEGWADYQLLDSGDGERLERYGHFTIVRPDPQILWSKSLPPSVWRTADAVFERTFEDKGNWKNFKKLPEQWPVHWRDLTFMAHLSPFKHTGIFPEQSAHWGWFRKLLEEQMQGQGSGTNQGVSDAQKSANTGSDSGDAADTRPNILNLFAYTGGASIVVAKTGAKITHVDASRASIGWAKKNQVASGLDEKSIRWILDDVVTFVEREVRRGTKYDGIIMDPPVYGHGPNGERWDFKKSLPILLELCEKLLVDKPLFVLINAYAVSTSAITLGNLLEQMMDKKGGSVSVGELALTNRVGETSEKLSAQNSTAPHTARLLSTGIWARWQEAM